MFSKFSVDVLKDDCELKTYIISKPHNLTKFEKPYG